MAAPIYVISGVPGAGKTTVARALASRFPAALVIVGDDLREMVASGLASPLDGWSSEHQVQFELSWRVSANMAARYADAGFVVVIDDVLRERDLAEHHYRELGDRRVRRVLLRPTLAAALARNRDRGSKPFAPERLVPTIQQLYGGLAGEPGWLVIDTTALSVDETVERILTGFDPAGQVRKY